jgi:PE family
MSFVIAAPEFVTAAAGDLAGIGSEIGAANAAAALPTTTVAAAAADEVSAGIAALFGRYAQQYQALSAQAAAFHNEFVSLLNGGAASYLSTEATSAGQTLLNAVNAPSTTTANFAANAAAGTPSLLGGILGGGTAAPIISLPPILGGGSGGLLGGLPPVLGGGSGGLLGGLGSLLGGVGTSLPSVASLESLLGGFNPSGLTGLFSSFNPNTFTSFLTSLTGPINLGNLTPGINLTSGPLGPTLNGVGLDLGNFLSNELVNGITLSNLESLGTGLFQDVPALQGLLPLLQSLLPGLFGSPTTGPVAPYPNPYQVLGETTVINLNLMGSTFAGHPFPILNQIASNQGIYLQEFSNGVAIDLQNFPANVPANFQLAIQGASSFNAAAMEQTFINGTSGFYGTVGTSLQNFGSEIQTTLPTFENDMGMAGTAISTGDYHGAVQDGAHAILGLFISGFDTSQLQLGLTGTLLPPSADLTIAGPIGLLGPAGALLPILTATGQQAQGLASLIPPGSIPAQMANNFANAIGTLTNGGISADFAVTIAALPPGGTLAGTAIFGVPLQLGFAVLGPSYAGLDGLATGAMAFSTALQTGNALGALNAIGDTPAYVLNGFLNGEILVDLPLPVTVDGITLPATAHLPFEGILVPPQPLTVTIPLNVLGIDIPINATLGGTQFGGLLPTLINSVPEQIAAAISPA